MAELISVPTSVFSLDIPPVDIYRKFRANPDSTEQTVLFRDRHLPVGDFSKEQLSRIPEGELFIKSTDLPVFIKYMEQMQKDIVRTSSISIEKRTELVQSLGINLAQELFHSPKKETMMRAQEFCKNIAELIIGNKGAFQKLMNLQHHDEYTYQHSLSVAGLAVGIAKLAGINDPAQLADLAVAGFLHDVGKAKISWDIINKPGKLNEQEWDVMRLHSLYGYQLTQHVEGIPARSKLAILQHHEAPGGVGYPAGLEGANLDLFTKIITVCDIFSALTTNRSYSKARTTFEALKLIKDSMWEKIDHRVYQILVIAMSEKASNL